MKINLPTNFLKSQKNFKKGGMHAEPGFFWHIILGVALVIILCSIAFGFLLFRAINKNPTSSDTTSTVPSQTIKKARIDSDLQYFTDRQKKSDDIIHTPLPFGDPSI